MRPLNQKRPIHSHREGRDAGQMAFVYCVTVLLLKTHSVELAKNLNIKKLKSNT